jgi:hypothetical protein
MGTPVLVEEGVGDGASLPAGPDVLPAESPLATVPGNVASVPKVSNAVNRPILRRKVRQLLD